MAGDGAVRRKYHRNATFWRWYVKPFVPFMVKTPFGGAFSSSSVSKIKLHAPPCAGSTYGATRLTPGMLPSGAPGTGSFSHSETSWLKPVTSSKAPKMPGGSHDAQIQDCAVAGGSAVDVW